MLPDRCSIRNNDVDCPNPPSHLVSVVHESGEYMIGVVCIEHMPYMEKLLETRIDLPERKIKFTELKNVGTDCVTNYPDE